MHSILAAPVVQVLLLCATAAVFVTAFLSGLGAIRLSFSLQLLTALGALAICCVVIVGIAQVIPSHASGIWTEQELLSNAQQGHIQEFDVVDARNGIAYTRDGHYWGVSITGDLSTLRTEIAADGVPVGTAVGDPVLAFPINLDFAAMGIAMLSWWMLGRAALR